MSMETKCALTYPRKILKYLSNTKKALQTHSGLLQSKRGPFPEMVDPCQFPSMIIKKCPLETKSLKSANQLKRARENLRTGIQIIQDVHVHTCTLSKSELPPSFSQK